MKVRETNRLPISTEIQEQAIQIACKKLGMGDHTTSFTSKKDASTKADELATCIFFHKNMQVRKSYMFCDALDMTFFYTEEGKAMYSYSGYSCDHDTPEKMFEVFQKAESLRHEMDDAIKELLTKNKDQIKETNDDLAM